MAWSKITNKCKKPWQWWMHKLFCEWGWLVRNKDNYATYYHHLNMCCKYGFNLYGEPISIGQSLIAANVEALAKKGDLEDKCSSLAPKFHSSKKLNLQRQAPFLPMKC